MTAPVEVITTGIESVMPVDTVVEIVFDMINAAALSEID
jgi:hypothetical protein